jgi:hypothetical protein
MKRKPTTGFHLATESSDSGEREEDCTEYQHGTFIPHTRIPVAREVLMRHFSRQVAIFSGVNESMC